VADIDQLDRYPFSGHGVIIGKHKQPWQNCESALLHFGKQLGYTGNLSPRELMKAAGTI
jgi:putative transposase